jgi:hypothetical protein
MYQFFFTVQQYSGFIAGLALAPMVLGNIFTLRLVGRFALTQPRHVVVAVGLGAMGLAALLTSLARPNLPYLFLVPMLVLFGCGFLMASTAWTHFFFSVLPADLSGLSAGINRAAGLFGSAVSGVVLAAIVEVSGMASFSLRLEGLGLTPEQQFEALETLEILLQARVTADELAQSPDALISLGLLSAYRDARSAAISAAMLALAGICLGCGALAWLWLRRAARGAALAGAAEEHSELQEA